MEPAVKEKEHRTLQPDKNMPKRDRMELRYIMTRLKIKKNLLDKGLIAKLKSPSQQQLER